MAFPSETGWAFFLTISYDMHLVVPTHLSLFWVVCHHSRTFTPKEFEWEPQNRLPLLPTARPYPLLPLTHGPPPLYWLGTSWRCLSLVRVPFPCVFKACLLLMRLPWPRGSSVYSAAHSWLLVAWIGFWAFILYGLLHSRAKPCLIVGCSILYPLFAPSIGLLVFLPCHSVILAMVLFGPCLSGLLWACYMLFLSLNYNGPMLSLGLYSCYFGFSWPIPSLTGFLGPFLPPWAFSAFTFPWVFANSFLDFPNPITISFTFGVHGLFHQPFTHLSHYFGPL